MSNEIDLVQLRLDIEEEVRHEYSDAMKKLNSELSEYRIKILPWQNMVENFKQFLISSGKMDEEIASDIQPYDLYHLVIEELSEYHKFSKLMKYINENELLESQWKKIVMGIRMTGGD